MTNATTTAPALEVGTFMNQKGYTDVYPFEIVKVVSEKTAEIRAMKAELDPEWKPKMIPGGFAAHCENNYSQKWVITPDPTAPVIRVRLGKKGWKDSHGNPYRHDAEPRRFYDYNF